MFKLVNKGEIALLIKEPIKEVIDLKEICWFTDF